MRSAAATSEATAVDSRMTTRSQSVWGRASGARDTLRRPETRTQAQAVTTAKMIPATTRCHDASSTMTETPVTSASPRVSHGRDRRVPVPIHSTATPYNGHTRLMPRPSSRVERPMELATNVSTAKSPNRGTVVQMARRVPTL